jgi:(2R)-ethylmalonyl-CoA mutase
VVGGIIPDDDQAKLLELGVAAVYTPKDYELTRMMSEMADLVSATRDR